MKRGGSVHGNVEHARTDPNSDMVSEAMAVLSEFPSHLPYMSALVLFLDKTVARKEEEAVQRVVDLMLELEVGQKTVDDVLFYARLKAGDVDGAKAIMTVSGTQSHNMKYTHKQYTAHITIEHNDTLTMLRVNVHNAQQRHRTGTLR